MVGLACYGQAEGKTCPAADATDILPLQHLVNNWFAMICCIFYAIKGRNNLSKLTHIHHPLHTQRTHHHTLSSSILHQLEVIVADVLPAVGALADLVYWVGKTLVADYHVFAFIEDYVLAARIADYASPLLVHLGRVVMTRTIPLSTLTTSLLERLPPFSNSSLALQHQRQNSLVRSQVDSCSSQHHLQHQHRLLRLEIGDNICPTKPGHLSHDDSVFDLAAENEGCVDDH